ncbi:MAG: LPS export ABC transporter permease LptG [Acidobacteriaceae bacterium]|nr:LPS export ABC transporter permease LptG [Acidobacteriaceae bacterium]
MRILTRYILREVTSHALLGGALFTFVLFMSNLGAIVALVVRQSASLMDVARILAYLLPGFLNVTIPMAVLAGILFGLSRLAADSEITAMRTSGMGALDFVRIVSIASLFAVALGLFNSLYLAPRAAAATLELDSLKSQQASFEVEPRVFYEDFKNYVLYIQDVHPATGAALWRHIFLADLTHPATPNITTADQAVVVGNDPDRIHLHLIDGTQHETLPGDPNHYNISTFQSTDLPIQTGSQQKSHLSRVDTAIFALPLGELWRLRNATASTIYGPSMHVYRIELNRRFSYPFACIVLMLIGVPLGLSSKRGGKSTGFVLTIALVFIYYFLSLLGLALARNGKLPPFWGVWGANIVFAVVGALLLLQMSRGSFALPFLSPTGAMLNRLLPRLARNGKSEGNGLDASTTLHRFRRALRLQFPLLLDEYVIREYISNFVQVLLIFSTLFLIFTFFELMGDIIRNGIKFVTVADYLFNLIPFILYNVTPLCALVAVLLTFGTLSRTSEITAMKATGVSLYRIVTPVLLATLVISVGLFVFDEFYLPAANRRQEALRETIKNKPARTFLRPDRQWISGQTGANGDPARIFYYQYFDKDRSAFANLTVFEFDANNFALRRRIFATTAHWDDHGSQWAFENGWQRTFAGETVASYEPFAQTTFPEIREQPGYFVKEDRPSQEMSYGELSTYIADLKQSGFDTRRLNLQLNRKLAYPLITLVMAMIAIPFSLTMGKRGSLAGIAIAIGLAITYWVVDGVFTAMGGVAILPAMMAAWTPDVLFAIAGTYLLLRTPT